MNRRRHPHECSTCQGMGQTDETRTEMHPNNRGLPVKTKRLGSGCPRCHGTGRVEFRLTGAAMEVRGWQEVKRIL